MNKSIGEIKEDLEKEVENSIKSQVGVWHLLGNHSHIMNQTEEGREFLQQGNEALDKKINDYQEDSRVGVQKTIEKCRKEMLKFEHEIIRTNVMSHYEHVYQEYEYICGIDEVGRGPLAGPVVAGAVILPKDFTLLHLNDSKKLSAKKREELYDLIMEHGIATGIGIVSAQEIDEINILQATYKAMRMAIEKLEVSPTLLLNDAVTIPQVMIKQVPIIKGDEKSISIAAASIIAKVTRDRLMESYDSVLPEYGFASNKGYGSQGHIDALRKYGPTPIHRNSFIKNFQ